MQGEREGGRVGGRSDCVTILIVDFPVGVLDF